MATIRPAKPDDWTQYELDFYGIGIETQNRQEFFGSVGFTPPAAVIHSIAGFATTQDRENAVDRETRKLLHYFDLMLDPQIGQEAAVDNFAAKLLEKLGYDDDDDCDRIIFIRRALPIVISGVPYITQADVCVMDEFNQVLLILQDDKLSPDLKDPEPQIVAKAIAAYGVNNKIRVTSLNRPPLPAITFPAISMVGTKLVFYKITVTDGLSAAVQRGRAEFETASRVVRCIPILPWPHGLGMRPLENRAEILACLGAFKQFMESSSGSPAPDSDTGSQSPRAESTGTRTSTTRKQNRHHPWTLFVRLPNTTNETDLKEFFGEAKDGITRVNIPPPFNGRERNIAYVEFIDEEAMNAGLDKHAEKLNDGVPEVKRSDRVPRDYSYRGGRGRGGHRGGGWYAHRGFAAGLTRGGGPKTNGDTQT